MASKGREACFVCRVCSRVGERSRIIVASQCGASFLGEEKCDRGPRGGWRGVSREPRRERGAGRARLAGKSVAARRFQGAISMRASVWQRRGGVQLAGLARTGGSLSPNSNATATQQQCAVCVCERGACCLPSSESQGGGAAKRSLVCCAWLKRCTTRACSSSSVDLLLAPPCFLVGFGLPHPVPSPSSSSLR